MNNSQYKEKEKEKMFDKQELEQIRILIHEHIKVVDEDLKKCNYDSNETDEYNNDFIVCDYELQWHEDLLKKIDLLIKEKE